MKIQGLAMRDGIDTATYGCVTWCFYWLCGKYCRAEAGLEGGVLL